MNTALDTTPTTETGRFAAGRDHTTARSGVAVLTAVLVGIALVMPDRTVGPGMTGSTMTHYMGLLAVNQPWNLLIFMALPVVLAETLAITELAILFAPRPPPLVLALNRWAGLLAGPVMLAITVHLVQHAVVPLTTGAGWRGTADVVAVLAYLTGLVPLAAITLVERAWSAAHRRPSASCTPSPSADSSSSPTSR